MFLHYIFDFFLFYILTNYKCVCCACALHVSDRVKVIYVKLYYHTHDLCLVAMFCVFLSTKVSTK